MTIIEFPKSFHVEYAWLNNFESRIYPLYRHFHILDKPQNNISTETKTPYMQEHITYYFEIPYC